MIRPALLADVKLDDLDALVELHLGCAIQLVQAALPAMRARSASAAWCCCRRAPRSALATRTSYSATKAGMLGMARTWALELAPDGITVNVVAPGPIRTDMFHDVVAAGSEQGARARRVDAGRAPRRGRPTSPAPCASSPTPANGFVTGQVLYVCGGTSVGSLRSEARCARASLQRAPPSGRVLQAAVTR